MLLLMLEDFFLFCDMFVCLFVFSYNNMKLTASLVAELKGVARGVDSRGRAYMDT